MPAKCLSRLIKDHRSSFNASYDKFRSISAVSAGLCTNLTGLAVWYFTLTIGLRTLLIQSSQPTALIPLLKTLNQGTAQKLNLRAAAVMPLSCWCRPNADAKCSLRD